MTPLLKELEQQEQASTERVSFLASLGEALSDFWEHSFRPAGRLLSQTVSILWHQAFIPAFKKSMANNRDRFERLAWTTIKKPKAPTMQLNTPSSLAAYRIHGAMGERWSAGGATERPIRVNVGKQNPWIAAERRVARVQPSSLARPAVVVKPEKMVDASSGQEIRGLDDIFTGPVQGSFVDVLLHPGKLSRANKKAGSLLTDSPGTAVTSAESAALQTLQAEAERSARQESSRMQALARKQAALRAESEKLGNRVRNIAESTRDWFIRHDVSVSQEAAEDSLIPAPVSLPAMLESIGLASYAFEEPVIPVAEIQPTVTPSFVSDQAAQTLVQPEPALAPETVLPAAAPFAESRTEGLRKAEVTETRPPELDCELAEDLSGFDYMLQNNRILSRSITNLVEHYFQQAALEEEPNYY